MLCTFVGKNIIMFPHNSYTHIYICNIHSYFPWNIYFCILSTNNITMRIKNLCTIYSRMWIGILIGKATLSFPFASLLKWGQPSLSATSLSSILQIQLFLSRVLKELVNTLKGSLVRIFIGCHTAKTCINTACISVHFDWFSCLLRLIRIFHVSRNSKATFPWWVGAHREFITIERHKDSR